MALVYKQLENGEGIAIDDGGRPIVVDDEKDENEEDREFGLDAIHLYSKIPQLNAEAKKYREERDAYRSRAEAFGELDPEEVRNKLEAIEGIDINEAKKAIETVANMDQLDKDKNIEIQKIKQQSEEAWKTKLENERKAHSRVVEDYNIKIQNKDNALRNLLIKGAFDSSQFIKDQTVTPPDMAYATFGPYFRVEEDEGKLKTVAVHQVSGPKHAAGDPIYSQSRPGDLAEPEEAIEILINEYPYKDSILRTNAGGSGSGGNTSGDARKRAEREELKGLSPTARLAKLREVG